MPDEQITEEVPVVEEVTEQPVITEEPVVEQPKQKFRRVIQPVDDEGKAIGSAHVYEADSQEELDEKMAQAIANGTKKIHQLSRQAKLEEPKIPEGAEPEVDVPVWKPRELTEDEKFIVKTDPEKAFDIQFEAKYGMSVEEKRKADQELYDNSAVLRAQAETKIFTDNHPDYYTCDRNRDAIIQFIQKNKLAWRAKNLDIAFRELNSSGLLVQAPEPVIETPKPPRTEAAVETTETKGSPQFPSAIRSTTGTGMKPAPAKKGPSDAEIAQMTSEQLKRLHPELRNAR